MPSKRSSVSRPVPTSILTRFIPDELSRNAKGFVLSFLGPDGRVVRSNAIRCIGCFGSPSIYRWLFTELFYTDSGFIVRAYSKEKGVCGNLITVIGQFTENGPCLAGALMASKPKGYSLVFPAISAFLSLSPI